ncbi:MAG: hypothetical protein ACYCOU_01245 [Sulfobacillus sp.]
MKNMLALLITVAVVIAAVFGLNYFGYFNYRFFAPKYAAVQSQVFHQSPEYVHGKIQELTGLESRYVMANKAQKAALRSVIIDEFAAYHGRLPAHLRRFYRRLRAQ